MRYSAPPYMYDVLPYASSKEPWLTTARWRAIERHFREMVLRAGYREIRTPILEPTELFKRSIGEATDIVSKEMFTFVDRGERSLTMKPEGTAPAVRACIEHGLFAEHPLLKLFYIGQNFRYERGQKGRYRQHQQLGVEVFGATDPAIDAEVLALAMSFFTTLGVRCRLHLNSVGTSECRATYREALKAYVRPSLAHLSEEGKMRFEVNPLRMLDTKDQKDLAILAGAPVLRDFLSEESSQHFAQVQEYLTALNIPFAIDDGLVRGFDYYSGTVFEIKGEGLGAQDALGGGGRYDGLVEECGGTAVPGLGFGIGMERCLLALEALGIAPPQDDESPVAFIITAGEQQAGKTTAVRLLQTLRSAGIAADMDYLGKNFRRQFKRADDLGTKFYIIIGEDEVASGTVQLKDRASGEQEKIELDSVVPVIKSKLL